MFRPEDLTPVDVNDYVRREQRRFFRSGSYDPNEVVMLLVAEALLSGASDVRITSEEGWIAVYADLDWLSGSEEKAFSGLAPFPAGGPNGIRAEIFPVIFARTVATATPFGARVVKGDSLGPLADPLAGWSRAVAFDVTSS